GAGYSTPSSSPSTWTTCRRTAPPPTTSSTSASLGRRYDRLERGVANELPDRNAGALRRRSQPLEVRWIEWHVDQGGRLLPARMVFCVLTIPARGLFKRLQFHFHPLVHSGVTIRKIRPSKAWICSTMKRLTVSGRLCC